MPNPQSPIPNGTKKSPKTYVASFPAWRLGMYSEWAAASHQERGGGASQSWFPASRLGTS
ncbi:MAG: hypothetical protein V7K86_10915 [Nostoc sp.]